MDLDNTLGVESQKKKKFTIPETPMVEVNLIRPAKRDFSRFDYRQLLTERGFSDTTVHADKFVSEDDIAVKEMVKRLEAKYGKEKAADEASPGKSTKKRRKPAVGHYEDYVDRGAGYDAEDSFIDDSEAYDELVPSTMDTIKHGFYVNTGRLEFKRIDGSTEEEDVDGISDDSDINLPSTSKKNTVKKSGKSRIIESDSEDEQSLSHLVKKSRLQNGEEKPNASAQLAVKAKSKNVAGAKLPKQYSKKKEKTALLHVPTSTGVVSGDDGVAITRVIDSVINNSASNSSPTVVVKKSFLPPSSSNIGGPLTKLRDVSEAEASALLMDMGCPIDLTVDDVSAVATNAAAVAIDSPIKTKPLVAATTDKTKKSPVDPLPVARRLTGMPPSKSKLQMAPMVSKPQDPQIVQLLDDIKKIAFQMCPNGVKARMTTQVDDLFIRLADRCCAVGFNQNDRKQIIVDASRPFFCEYETVKQRMNKRRKEILESQTNDTHAQTASLADKVKQETPSTISATSAPGVTAKGSTKRAAASAHPTRKATTSNSASASPSDQELLNSLLTKCQLICDEFSKGIENLTHGSKGHKYEKSTLKQLAKQSPALEPFRVALLALSKLVHTYHSRNPSSAMSFHDCLRAVFVSQLVPSVDACVPGVMTVDDFMDIVYPNKSLLEAVANKQRKQLPDGKTMGKVTVAQQRTVLQQPRGNGNTSQKPAKTTCIHSHGQQSDPFAFTEHPAAEPKAHTITAGSQNSITPSSSPQKQTPPTASQHKPTATNITKTSTQTATVAAPKSLHSHLSSHSVAMSKVSPAPVPQSPSFGVTTSTTPLSASSSSAKKQTPAGCGRTENASHREPTATSLVHRVSALAPPPCTVTNVSVGHRQTTPSSPHRPLQAPSYSTTAHQLLTSAISNQQSAAEPSYASGMAAAFRCTTPISSPQLPTTSSYISPVVSSDQLRAYQANLHQLQQDYSNEIQQRYLAYSQSQQRMRSPQSSLQPPTPQNYKPFSGR